MSSRAGESVAIKLTGDAASAIAVIEISGPEVQPWIERHWSPNSGIRTLDINAIRYGSIEHFDTTDSETAFAESVILCRTGPDQFELHCHGGELASQSILTKLASEGFHIQPSSTWIREHSEDEFSAEATQALLKAKTTQTARILLDQQRGALSNAVATIEQAISSGDFTTAKSKIQELRNWGQIGLHLLTPFQVLLCGPPNVGKSSLMNRVLGYQRAIVHEQAGTTRDLLEEETSFSGWPVKLLDSAGVRVAENKIEQQGIERTLAASDRVDLQWILVDPQQGWTPSHQSLWDRKPDNSIVVVTKSDLASQREFYPPVATWISISAITGEGIGSLLEQTVGCLVREVPFPGTAVPFLDRHLQRLDTLERTLNNSR